MILLEENSIYQNAQQMQRLNSRIKALKPFYQEQVRLLAMTTAHTWESALEAVLAGDYRERPKARPLMPRELAHINLPIPNKPRGQRLTRRQRGRR